MPKSVRSYRSEACDPADRLKPQSFGLRGMSERARALGGTLALSAAPGGGTMVTIKIRLAQAAVRDHAAMRAPRGALSCSSGVGTTRF